MTTRSENAPTRTDWDVVVVGAGVGGLSTAAYLATNGKRVLVLEASKVVGGASQSFRRNRVFDFDCGAHYVGDCEPGGVIPTVLRGVGLEDEVHFTSLDPDRFDRLIGPDGFEFEVPRGWDEFESRLTARFPAETDAVRHVLSALRGIAEATRTLGAPPAPRPMDVLRHPRATIKLAEGIDSLEHLFDRHDLSDGARTAIGYLCMFLMQPRSEIAAAVYAGMLDHYIRSGGFYVNGGASKIPRSLARVVRSHGGEVRLRARVAEILVREGVVEGVRLADGDVVHAPVVVSNADIRTTYDTLIDHRHTSSRTRRQRTEAPLTGCGFSVYLGVDIDLREHMPAQTVFSFATLDYNQLTDPLHDPETDFDYDQPWIWITSGTLNEGPRPGTDGYSSLEVTTFTPQNYAFWGLEGGVLDGIDYHRDPAYLEQKQRVEQAVVQAAIRTLPFLDGHIVWQESATMLSYEDWTSTRLGAWAGLDFSLPNLIFRPGPKTDINGLYLAGASSNSGGAILGTLLGGVATAGAILGRDLWRDVRSGAVYGHGLTDTGVSLPDVPAAGFHRLRVRGIQQQTPDSVVAELEVPEHLRETFAHEAGQHLTVRGASQGELLRRSYSICSPAGQDQLSIGVKHVPGGTFSTHAVTRLRIGDVLEVAPPQGRFTPPADTRHVAAVAAGSGVTPIYSIVATLFASQPDTTCTLLYGNRTADSIMFKQELAGLSRRYPGRLRVEHYLSRETEDGYHSGRVDGDAIAELAKELNADAWFVCGPAGLVEEAEKALVDSSVDPDRVHVERFDGVAGTAPVAVGRSTVRVTAGGSTDEFVMSRGDVILDAALSERDDMPYSCLSGSCGTCIAKLCAGSVEAIDDGDYALTAAEIADGLFLTCLARPTSDVVVVDFAR